MKFEEMKYERPDIDAFCNDIENYAKRISNAASGNEQLKLYSEYEKKMSEVMTMLSLGELRYFLDTSDKFFSEEMRYIGSVMPKIELTEKKIIVALLESRYRNELEASLGSFFFIKASAKCEGIDEAIADLMAEEAELSQQYEQLVSQAVVEFEGQEYSAYSMSKFFTDTNRERRKQAQKTVNAWYETHHQVLDDIFGKLVKNRTEQARRLGFETYTDMTYSKRIGYGRKDVENFRKQVSEKWVPFVSKIKDQQRKRLGLDTFRIYDSALRFKDGNPKLIVNNDMFVKTLSTVFNQMSPETGAYFDLLEKNDMLDLFDRPNKITYDAFCLQLQEYKMDFICGHCDGKESDVESIVHEFGHAFASRRALLQDIPNFLQDAGQDISETHSKTMELLIEPYYDLFFSEEDTKKYKQKQLEYASYFISAICIGDEFQHELYDHPDMTPSERNDTYERIYKKYNPYIDYSDLPFSSWGSMWQDKLVIYSMPFYYIDYALAQTLALEFYAESLNNFHAAWARYLKFLDCAGTKSFPDIIEFCGLISPFDEDCFDHILNNLSAN
jgi:M3 family oligoendopeptidase